VGLFNKLIQSEERMMKIVFFLFVCLKPLKLERNKNPIYLKSKVFEYLHSQPKEFHEHDLNFKLNNRCYTVNTSSIERNEEFFQTEQEKCKK
jgi:hypothetical protein